MQLHYSRDLADKEHLMIEIESFDGEQSFSCDE